MKLLFSFCSVTGLKVSLYVFGRFCQASPNRVEVIWPCNLAVNTAFLVHSSFDKVALEFANLKANPGSTPVCMIKYEEAGVRMLGWDSLRILQPAKMQYPIHISRTTYPLLLCWDESFLFPFRVATNFIFSPLAVICIRASHLLLACPLPSLSLPHQPTH